MTSWDRLLADPWFPFEGHLTVKVLAPPVVPEPARAGERADDCDTCARRDEEFIWTDQVWALRGVRDTSLPGVVLLVTRDHHDSFSDLPDPLLAALGPMTARVERALLSLPDVGRVHVCRWGDGSAHFHQWFLPRPLGAMQMRGSMLPMWLDLMEPLPAPQVDAALAVIAAAMSEGP